MCELAAGGLNALSGVIAQATQLLKTSHGLVTTSSSTRHIISETGGLRLRVSSVPQRAPYRKIGVASPLFGIGEPACQRSI